MSETILKMQYNLDILKTHDWNFTMKRHRHSYFNYEKSYFASDELISNSDSALALR